jgi:hypothetical protein
MRRSGWDTKFTETIPLPKGKPLATPQPTSLSCPRQNNKPMNGRPQSVAFGGREQRPVDVCKNRIHAGAKPARRAGVQSRSERHALGKAEIEEGWMSGGIL